MQEPSSWLYHYQTLVTGIAAVLVAAGTVVYLHWQFAVQRRQRLRVHRAGLPLALSELSGYASACAKEIARLDLMSNTLSDDEQRAAFPEFPSGALIAVRDAIEAVPAGNAQVLSELISFAQVQRARLERLIDRFSGQSSNSQWCVSSNDFGDRMRDAIGLYAFVDRVFPFARGRSEQIGEFCSAEEAKGKLRINFGISAVQLVDDAVRHWPPRI